MPFELDPSIVISAITLFVTVAMQLVGFGKIIGQVSVRLDSHDEQHIRHETRIDEHAKLIRQHDKDLAILKDRRERND